MLTCLTDVLFHCRCTNRLVMFSNSTLVYGLIKQKIQYKVFISELYRYWHNHT